MFWRDIPSQVIVQRGRRREKRMLSRRFQEAIDSAAMRAGKGSSNAYIAEWRREVRQTESDDDLCHVVETEAARFESEYSDEQLLALVRNHGEWREL
ncbi:MAG: virulence factor [Woeseiaceae bacterium]